ncbi:MULTISPECIES: ABC transporter permease [unclassified Streptomyces]|uniref:ABC transporter permease n=1 Tax=unclassified Streptomyces TaxID=2593676 RepID=UPI002DDC20E4|nr:MULTISPECIES: ABC transporter permease [unclassified Streptomyces]WSA91554.1 ABC transporter permease [Streptomyces sp. NBC_01795]WSS15800.1 ABC transporter permease [Streptomyces sp. NBC_01186]WSS44639.1 ABC transporter permease [Streptomyces sp. NBC_01187]
MFSLALRSVRKRPGRFVATLLAAFLGATITMAFNSLHDTAGTAGIDAAGEETLTLSASVVGGYGTLLVFFALASTLTVNVRQRASEISLLRRTGATPAQIKRMVVGEAAVVALVGWALALVPAMFGGRALLWMFQDSGQVADSVDPVFGPVGVSAGLSITLLAAVGASFLAVRRATRALAGAKAPRGRLRAAAGAGALLLGAGGLAATFAIDSDEPALMAAPGYGAIMLSVGFATLAPALMRGLLAVLGRPVAALTGAGGHLAVLNTRRRAAQLSGVLMPLILFTGIATATVSMQLINNAAIKASGLTRTVDDKNLETVNLVVVGIIGVFCCVMLINTLYASTTYRSGEFGRQRLAGATPRQVLRTVGVEGALLTAVGVFFGTVAGLSGTLVFHAARTDSVSLPGSIPGVFAGTAAVAAAATLLTLVATARRTLRTPAVNAVTVAA